METPAKLKKAMENTIRERRPQRVPEFDIWVKASEESESGLATGYVNVKNASQPNGLENFNTYNNQISFMETESHCYLMKLQHQLLL